jgi:hypothetical protein
LSKSRLALDGLDVFFGASPKEVSALSGPPADTGELPAIPRLRSGTIAKFLAAFKSRSQSNPHFSQRYTRSDNGIESLTSEPFERLSQDDNFQKDGMDPLSGSMQQNASTPENSVNRPILRMFS